MKTNEDKVKMAADLYKMRDKAKMLLGEKYKSHMEDLGKIITEWSKRDNKSPLQVVISHCSKKQLNGMELIFTMAAAVELEEPSK